MRLHHLAAALLAVAAATPATAQSVVATDPNTVVQAMQAKGYQAQAETKAGEDPVIRSSAAGAKFTVLFYNCAKGKDCSTVQFYAGFKNDAAKPVDAARMNVWNKEHRFARAYLDGDGDPVLEMDVNLDLGGISRALFADHLEVWSGLIGQYRTFVHGS